MNTYILCSYTALQSVDHNDLEVIADTVTRHGGTCTTLPQTVIACMTTTQYAKFTMDDVQLPSDTNIVCLHTYQG